MAKKPAPAPEPALTVSEIRSDSVITSQGNPVQLGVLADGTLVALDPTSGLVLETES